MARDLNMAVVISLESTEWQDVDEVAWQETMQKSNKVGLLKNVSGFGATFHCQAVPI